MIFRCGLWLLSACALAPLICTLAKGQEPVIFHGIETASVAFSSDGRMLAAGGWKHKPRKKGSEDALCIGPGIVKVWDIATCRQIFEYSDELFEVEHVDFSPKAPLLAVAFARRLERKGNVVEIDLSKPHPPSSVEVWNVETRKKLFTLEHNELIVNCAVFSPDGKTLATETFDNHGCDILFWDVQTGQRRGNLRVDNPARNLVYSPNGTMLACSMVRWVKSEHFTDTELINLADNKRKARFSSKNLRVSLAFSPNGQWFALGGNDSGSVELYDLQNHKNAGSFAAHSTPNNTLRLTGLAFSPDSRIIYTTGLDQKGKEFAISWKAWDLATQRLIHVQKAPPQPPDALGNPFSCLAVSSDGLHLATGGMDGAVRLWKLPKLLAKPSR